MREVVTIAKSVYADFRYLIGDHNASEALDQVLRSWCHLKRRELQCQVQPVDAAIAAALANLD